MKYLNRIVIIFLFSVCTLFLKAQVADSLKGLLKTKLHDSVRVALLAQLTEVCELEEIIPFANECIRLCKLNLAIPNQKNKRIFYKNMALALNNCGYLKKELGEIKEALVFYKEAYSISVKLNEREDIGATLVNIGSVLEFQGNMDEAIENYLKGLNIFIQCNNKAAQASILNNIGVNYSRRGMSDSAYAYFLKSLHIKEELKLEDKIPVTLGNIGDFFMEQGSDSMACYYYEKALSKYKARKDLLGQATINNNLAFVYERQGNIRKALDYYHLAMTCDDKAGNKQGATITLVNIANIHVSLGDLDKALELFRKAAVIFDEQKDFTGCANTFDNMGTAYLQKKDTSMAMVMYEKSYAIAEKAKSWKYIVQSLSSMATVYMSRKNYTIAGEYFEKALRLSEKSNSAQKTCHLLNKMAVFNYLRGNISQAKELAERNFKLSKQYGFTENIRNAAEILWKIYDKRKESGKAYEMFKLFVSLRDTLFNKELQKVTVRKQFEYEYDKKSLEDSLIYAKEKQLKDAELTAQGAELKAKRNQQYALYGGLALVIVFSGFMYNRFKVTQRQKVVIEAKEKETHSQNIIITQQKHLVEEKHKEITDSINYAERIQRSFMATKELLDNKLGDYFVLFKPKDVVSGDFYWAEEAHSKFYIATADSTGHGVPGAIMSLLNITSLERAIESCQNPDQILNHTRKTIINRLKRDGSAEGGKDGMDCSLLCFDSAKKILTVAAAHNPVWIIRTNNEEKEFIEIKGDKMPVGKHDNDQKSFTLHTLNLQKGDVIYTLTDGFPDQFGGENGKKFMSKRLKELLQSISHLSLSEQKQILEETFSNWVSNLEQVDDVTVIGIKV